jgi:hypothetical protein
MATPTKNIAKTETRKPPIAKGKERTHLGTVLEREKHRKEDATCKISGGWRRITSKGQRARKMRNTHTRDKEE